MASKNDNPLEQIGGFFEALFGSCMGEERKAVKKKDDLRVSSQAKPDNQGSVLENLFSAFNHDKAEIGGFVQDARQMREMASHKDGGMGSKISEVSEYTVGQKPPGFIADLLNMITGPIPSYARPLSPERREKTVDSLRQFSKENSSNDSHGLSQRAKDIADNLEKRDNFGYVHQSLASAANAAGMTKEKIKAIYKIIKKSHAEEEAKDLASDLRQNPQNKQLFSLGFSGSSQADNSSPQLKQTSPIYGVPGAGTSQANGLTHAQRVISKRSKGNGGGAHRSLPGG